MAFNVVVHSSIDMSSRSRSEIVTQILEVANGSGSDGATKTEIMYKVFLSYVQLKEYLVVLIESGLLRYVGETHTFKITEKGLRFLEAYNQIDHVLNS
jgi:predicted transcriptional regulator